MRRILVGSAVRQSPTILEQFLASLRELDAGDAVVDFAFVDDNDEATSRGLLASFRPPGNVRLLPGQSGGAAYARNGVTHYWREELVWKVAAYKDRLIDLARGDGYDGLFLVDSDLVLHPATLRQLMAADVDICASIYWTRWTPEQRELPNVWLRDVYTLHEQGRDEELAPEEVERRQEDFLAKLRKPGLYEVGGLGACTLLSRRALDKGVGFREVPNLGYWGEDRHFCVRAAALGLKLHVDTRYPSLHLYRDEDLGKVADFRASFAAAQQAVEAANALRRALETRGTTHHLTMTGAEGLGAFAPPLRTVYEDEATQMVVEARRVGWASRLELLTARAAMAADGGARVDATAVQTGREDGASFADHVAIEATLDRGAEGWLVRELSAEVAGQPPPRIPFVRRTRNQRVTLSMLVRNEADRYLRCVLGHAASYVDDVVIVDDASTDETVAVCEDVLRGLPHTVVSLEAPMFEREHELRRVQWEVTLATRPDWVLCLDADELFEDAIRRELPPLVNRDDADVVAFRLYDFWDTDHFREDGHWQAHRIHRPLLVRPVPGLDDAWPTRDQHAGRFPPSVLGLTWANSGVRLKHLGWATADDRQRKYERYKRLDPDGVFGNMAQYESILDPHPTLIPWEE